MSTLPPTTPFYSEDVSTGWEVTDAQTAILQGHTGTLDTTAHNPDRLVNNPGTGDDWDLGDDGSAATIQSALRATPTVGVHAGPAYTTPIF